MFYEMLTHELPARPFPAAKPEVQVDVRLDHVVLKAMQSEPERRYASATEMRTEVDEVRTGEVAVASSRRESESSDERRQDATATTGVESLATSATESDSPGSKKSGVVIVAES